MADGPFTCTECDRPVQRAGAACSATCRSRRKRRRDSEAASGRSTSKLVTDDAERAAREALRKHIEPVVKEAITDELVQRIHDMIGGVPDAIDAVLEDISPQPDDEGNLTDAQLDRRQRAYTQLLKLTAGNSNLVPDINADKQRDLTVIFGGAMARTGGDSDTDAPGVIESKECDACHTAKPLSEFVGSSDRCKVCFKEMQDAARGILPELRGE
jgi:hypothetical protein